MQMDVRNKARLEALTDINNKLIATVSAKTVAQMSASRSASEALDHYFTLVATFNWIAEGGLDAIRQSDDGDERVLGYLDATIPTVNALSRLRSEHLDAALADAYRLAQSDGTEPAFAKRFNELWDEQGLAPSVRNIVPRWDSMAIELRLRT